MDEATITKITEAVRDQVKITVNGKIEDVKKHLLEQDEKLEEMSKKIDELAPFVESKNVLVGLRKFVVWVATPATVIWGAWKFLAR